MSAKALNEYRIHTNDNKDQLFCAEHMSDAVAAFEVGTVEVEEAVTMQTGVMVDVPDADIRFNVTVLPTAAVTAGCVALPTTFIVKSGSKVILQAVPAPSSTYTFTGWYRGIALLSSELVAEVLVIAPVAGAIADEIEARFTLVP